ncbi:cystinosin homolog [Schistocerca gregaria]|uniref:cystinosin homolog n=1 Tax=Schistocerca gregaria TaxID=7010 RepID=UPI00211ED0CD|nr:cystinosin homolog [Schistocerca gregaria]
MQGKMLKVLTLLLAAVAPYGSCTSLELQFTPQDLTLLKGASTSILLSLKKSPDNATIEISADHADLVYIYPSTITVIEGNVSEAWTVNVTAVDVGRALVAANTSSSLIDVTEAFVRLTIQHSDFLYHASIVVGWVYFAAWSISFYPQIYINWKRKSVVGLNFDFLSLNILGFILYSLFNCGLYWIPEVEEEYFKLYPKGLNPVQVNDIVFALHASFATFITIVQCFIYERGDQTVSITARVIHGIFALFLFISVILAATLVITWLDFLYYCSYVKLAITLIKYVPQAYMNYKRKSTVGWSIGNILLDFTGGMLSMLQMIFNAYNYNDWNSIFGDPTKFGLGLFSVIFDIFFIIQHYVLYRTRGYEVVAGTTTTSSSTEPISA